MKGRHYEGSIQYLLLLNLLLYLLNLRMRVYILYLRMRVYIRILYLLMYLLNLRMRVVFTVRVNCHGSIYNRNTSINHLLKIVLVCLRVCSDCGNEDLYIMVLRV